MVRYGGLFLLAEQMGHDVGLPTGLLCIRTHSLTENVALVGFKNLLVAQSEQLPVSLSLNLLRILSLMTILRDMFFPVILICLKWFTICILRHPDKLNSVHRWWLFLALSI